MATYVAMTTQNEQMCGWRVVTIGRAGESRAVVAERAADLIVGDQVDRAKDIHVDTELKNLRVLPKSKVANGLLNRYDEDDAGNQD